MSKIDYREICPKTTSKSESDIMYIQADTDLYKKAVDDQNYDFIEDTDVYIKNKEDRSYDFIEDTDQYKKSGKKLILSIPLDL